MRLITAFFIFALSLDLPAQSNMQNNQLQTPEGALNSTSDIQHSTFNRHTPHKNLSSSYIALWDSVYYWNWDTINLNWSNNQAYNKFVNYVYDSHNNNTSCMSMNWNGTAWVNAYLYKMTYNSDNFITTDTVFLWSGSAWVNSNLWTYTNDAHNNELTYEYQSGSGSSWVNSTLWTYTYDANNNQLTWETQNWSGSAWQNQDLNIYTYDVNNNQLTALFQNWSGSAWTNTEQELYTYNVNNKQILDITQNWNGSAWVNLSKDTMVYNVNNYEDSLINYNWSTSVWVKAQLNTYTYDANNNLLVNLQQIWNSAWQNELRWTDAYNSDNEETSGYSQGWNGIAWENENQSVGNDYYDVDNLMQAQTNWDYNPAGAKYIWGDSTYIYLTPVLGINQLLVVSSQLSVYPNPSTGIFTFQAISHQLSAISQIEVYNVLGQQVYTQFIAHSSSFIVDLRSKSEGVYFYRVIGEDGAEMGSGKIVIQK